MTSDLSADGTSTAMAGSRRYVAASPYSWPFDGDLRRGNTALVVIDMQADFCGRGGYIDLLGYDISMTRACVEPIPRIPHARRAPGRLIRSAREQEVALAP
jgi:hypothetical protein